MGAPQPADDGSTTLTTTDSTGGAYIFTQPAVPAPAASIRSAGSSSGGTWDYTNSKGIKQFAGSYSGDITSKGAGNLNLTVEKAADPSGNMQVVTSPQSFSFEVSDTGTFSATIPAVEIKVPVEPAQPETQPAATVELIKTVTMTGSNSGSGYYTDDAYTEIYKFYSDNTFKEYADYTHTFKEVNFIRKFDGPYATGTYTGNPLVDGVVTLTIQKWNEGVARDLNAGDDSQVHAAYIAGATSKTTTITEADLEPFPSPYPMKILISGDTFSHLYQKDFSYTPNEDGSTTFCVNASGDAASSVSLSYTVVQFTDDNGSWRSTGMSAKADFSQRIAIADATEKTGVSLTVFLDKDGNGSYNSSSDEEVCDSISTVPIKPGHHIEVNLDIEKFSIPFTVQGNTGQYQNSRITAEYGGPTVPMADRKIEVYVASESGNRPYITLTAREYVQEYFQEGGSRITSYAISDSIELNLADGAVPPFVTFTLYDKLEEGKKIAVEEYPSDATFTAEEKKHFRFVRGTDGNIIFYIPTGTGSDGEFLSTIATRVHQTESLSSLQSSLIATTYANLLSFRDSASNNLDGQFTGLVDNMKDVVNFLEKRMKLTVYGKELIGL